MSEWTSRLFAMPSWVSGAGRVLDMGGVLDSWNQSQTPAEADRAALRADFLAVAEDVDKALAEVVAQE